MLAAETARILGGIRDLEGFYVEKEAQEYWQLCEALARTDHRHRTYQGPVQDHLPAIMDAVGAAPLFAFFDPFGLGVPFDMLTERILSRKRGQIGPATELLLNFSLPGLRRNAGHLTSKSTDSRYLKARATLIGRVDRDTRRRLVASDLGNGQRAARGRHRVWLRGAAEECGRGVGAGHNSRPKPVGRAYGLLSHLSYELSGWPLGI